MPKTVGVSQSWVRAKGGGEQVDMPEARVEIQSLYGRIGETKKCIGEMKIRSPVECWLVRALSSSSVDARQYWFLDNQESLYKQKQLNYRNKNSQTHPISQNNFQNTNHSCMPHAVWNSRHWSMETLKPSLPSDRASPASSALVLYLAMLKTCWSWRRLNCFSGCLATKTWMASRTSSPRPTTTSRTSSWISDLYGAGLSENCFTQVLWQQFFTSAGATVCSWLATNSKMPRRSGTFRSLKARCTSAGSLDRPGQKRSRNCWRSCGTCKCQSELILCWSGRSFRFTGIRGCIVIWIYELLDLVIVSRILQLYQNGFSIKIGICAGLAESDSGVVQNTFLGLNSSVTVSELCVFVSTFV
ncbi:Hypothetical_protein [Hexamita inflata]|uniref:Hypothetical_protein n=1 Tax=Hexamita inflata TaxID=28002 RepID=A0AA86P0J2_9EUKA|nr:Hypothetical protein HINF_LOCUS15849 [Hexamita inflata]